ncbi:MAG: hypothetical protein HN580_09685 [Deltaproteobacteria bacterium]|jgi:hypothetical protein|nr:hypothetical protein [Deltaproteobacteria bacterium]MBT4263812.1 hypothetical protein [Deltaproteobacteria bacterium]MBT4640507.1 hypothetical protein [Deltaproteobacteria bacterium]MBT6502257.1 hypothetical protein [Deltaproteobacteria bacterium]MBT7153738.1 hypothetical protein [Deltaproteobacteria bacterium]
MKALKKVLVTAIIGMLIGTSGIALAQGWGKGHGFSKQGFRGAGLFMRDEMVNSRVEVLAEVTGQSEETIKAKLQNKPVWAVLDEHKVEFIVFQTKMNGKRTTAIKQAVADGKITQAQADTMIERMGQNPRGFRGGHGRGHGRGFGGNCQMF